MKTDPATFVVTEFSWFDDYKEEIYKEVTALIFGNTVGSQL